MKRTCYQAIINQALIIVLLSSLTIAVTAQADNKLFIQDSLRLVSAQFKFTEGPAADKAGNVFFTDQPNNTIWKYDIEGNLSLFMDNAGRSNGLYFDKKGNLLSCADEHNQLWSISPDKKITVLLKDMDGQMLNGPNDLWMDTKGGIYFTDPYYQRDYWIRTKPEITGEKVYYLPYGKKKAIMVADQLKQPNGIIGSPDGKILYVADIRDNKTYRYDIKNDGTLTNQQLLIDKGSDGMTLDEAGNIYLTGRGVSIYNPTGVEIGHIEVPENWTGNVCFGGKKRDQLFITASKSLYILPMLIHGVK